MSVTAFLSLLALSMGALLAWGFRVLPGERWQILAILPLAKSEAGDWRGLNITWYGLLSATGYAIAVALLVILTGSIGVHPLMTLALVTLTLAIAMPAARWVAILVEGKRHTFTVAGAFFVGVLATPLVLGAVNWALADALGGPLPLLPVMATMAIAYSFGEGIGRLACISFGCCYGRPVSETQNPLLAWVFRRWHFVFQGDLKKIAYAGGLQGVQVAPIQAITAIVYVVTGLAGIGIFLASHYLAAFFLAMGVTQLWRAWSETMRADYRGAGRISAYQIMALIATLYAAGLGLWLADAPAPRAELAAGLATLWQPGMLLFLQAVWATAFVYMGRSSITEARVSIRVCMDRV